MKKLLILFVFGLLFFSSATFANDDEEQSDSVEGEEIESVVEENVLLRHQDNRIRQTISTLERLQNQLEKIQKDIEKLQEKEKDLKEKIAELKLNGKADWKDSLEEEEDDEEKVMKEQDWVKVPRVNENKPPVEEKKVEKAIENMKLSADQAKVRERASEAKKRLMKYRNWFKAIR